NPAQWQALGFRLRAADAIRLRTSNCGFRQAAGLKPAAQSPKAAAAISSLLTRNRVEEFVPPHIHRRLDERGRRIEAVLERVLREDLVLGTVAKDERDTVAPGDVDPPLRADGRREHFAELREPLGLVVRLARLGVEGRENS